ncbi:hypothetical protein L4C54_17735 [Vibrio lamellibrachiae]|uniref:hypothetical protein n=1 Tax=Vibrio lamellibrachiae TaxID=2910253 RepID=UPI003D0A6F49
MRLIFHGGLSKSGSTTIQTVLQNNKETLRERGYLIPNTGIKFRSRHHYYYSLNGGDYKDLVDQLYSEFIDSGCHTIIMSEESLNKSICYDKHNYLKKVFANVEFVFYLRRQDTLLESYYNQTIKVPWDKNRSQSPKSTLVDYSESLHWLNYGNLLDCFSNIVGKENIKVIPFERGQLSNNIAKDFLEKYCNVDTSGLNVIERVDNTSIPYSSLGLAIEINKIDMKFLGEPSFIRRALHEFFRARYKDVSSNILTYDERVSLMNTYVEGNSYVAREYLNRSDGRLFYENLPDKNTPIQATEILEADENDFIEKIKPILEHLKGDDLSKINQDYILNKTLGFMDKNESTLRSDFFYELLIQARAIRPKGPRVLRLLKGCADED